MASCTEFIRVTVVYTPLMLFHAQSSATEDLRIIMAKIWCFFKKDKKIGGNF